MTNRRPFASRLRHRRSYLHDLTEALRRHPELRAPRPTVYRAEIDWQGPAKPDDPILARLRQEGD